MTGLADALPQDVEALQALILTERAADATDAAEAERLRQIIKEMQRHHFGRRAETLPLDHDGRIELDNNIVERSIRPLALTRKNSLFAGSDGGTDHWAILASLIETAKLNGADPQAYITRILAGHPQSQIDQLMAWNYRP